jgi:IS5 family transposase
MDDLVKRLRDPTNNWNSGGRFEAAARIEAQAAMLRECVKAFLAVLNDIDGDDYNPVRWDAKKKKARTTLARAKEMIGE